MQQWSMRSGVLTVGNQCVKIVLVAFLLSGSVYAVNLGGVRVLSQAGELLRAEVALTGVTAADVGAVRATLASPDIFAASGLNYPAVLDTVRISVVGGGDNFVLRLTSTQAVTDALLTPIIELTANGATQLKAISLAIPGGRAAAQVTAATAAGGTEMPPWPVPGPSLTPPALQPKPVAAPAVAQSVPRAAPAVASQVALPAAAPAPAPNAVAKVTEVLRQELKQQMLGSNDPETLQKQLGEAKIRIDVLNGLVERMGSLITTQQRIIDTQAGVQPNVRLPGPDGATADPEAPVVVPGESPGIDPQRLLMGVGGGVMGLGLLWLALTVWQRRRRSISPSLLAGDAA